MSQIYVYIYISMLSIRLQQQTALLQLSLISCEIRMSTDRKSWKNLYRKELSRGHLHAPLLSLRNCYKYIYIYIYIHYISTYYNVTSTQKRSLFEGRCTYVFRKRRSTITLISCVILSIMNLIAN